MTFSRAIKTAKEAIWGTGKKYQMKWAGVDEMEQFFHADVSRLQQWLVTLVLAFSDFLSSLGGEGWGEGQATLCLRGEADAALFF